MASELSPRSSSPSPSPSPGDEGTERTLLSSSSSSITITNTPSATSPVTEDTRPHLHHRAVPNAEGVHRSGSGSPVQSFSRPGSRPSQLMRSNSLERVGQAAAETYLITRLAIILLRYFGLGYRWITKLLALLCYIILVLPGIIQVGYYYFFSRHVRRSIIYAGQPRNRLDLYLPSKVDNLRPVVIFITGGAWIIGYKAWGSLLGRRLAKRGIIVACVDYRNFPQGTIHHMVEDVSRGISFVCNTAQNYGGDPNRIYLIGQSAGAHIAACAIVNQAIKECGGENTYWSIFQIRAYFGISGGYNLPELVDHFHGRGLYRSIFLSIMEGEKSLHRFSPELLVKDPSVKKAISLLPPIILYHGTSDQSIPVTASKKFVESLHSVGAKAKFISFEGKSHTDLFLQDPLRGGWDETMEHIVAAIYSDDEAELAKVAAAPLPRRLVPEFMLKLAHDISPF